MDQCQKSGCVVDMCFQHCKFSADGKPIDGPWYMQEPLYLRWKQWDCQSDCRYHCMLMREEEREKLGGKPVKYHGKWPFIRVYGIQVFLHFSIVVLYNRLNSTKFKFLLKMLCFLRSLLLLLCLPSTFPCNSMVGYRSSSFCTTSYL